MSLKIHFRFDFSPSNRGVINTVITFGILVQYDSKANGMYSEYCCFASRDIPGKKYKRKTKKKKGNVSPNELITFNGLSYTTK